QFAHGGLVGAEPGGHGRCRGSGYEHRYMDAVGCQFAVDRLSEPEDVGLGGRVVGDVRHALDAGDAGDEQDAAATPGDHRLSEVVGQAQVAFGVDPQFGQERVVGGGQELAEVHVAGVGDDEADVEVGDGRGQRPEEVRRVQVDRHAA